MFNDTQLGNLEEVRKFLDGSVQFAFRPLQCNERAQWIRKTLMRFKINSVDEVTQWQIPPAVENLRESCVEPALDEAFLLFPFLTHNFHSDI